MSSEFIIMCATCLPPDGTFPVLPSCMSNNSPSCLNDHLHFSFFSPTFLSLSLQWKLQNHNLYKTQGENNWTVILTKTELMCEAFSIRKKKTKILTVWLENLMETRSHQTLLLLWVNLTINAQMVALPLNASPLVHQSSRLFHIIPCFTAGTLGRKLEVFVRSGT